MHRGNWYWWAAVAVAAALALPAGIAAVTGAAWALIYLLSLAIHPFMTCRSCAGSGRRHGAFFTGAHRQCMACGGQGRHRRWGATALYRGRQTWAERRAEDARDNRPGRPM